MKPPTSRARLDYSDGQLSEIKAAMDETGVYIRTMCLSLHRKFPLGSHDAEVRRKSMDIMRKAVEFAYKLGIRIIQLAGYDVYYETGDEQTRCWFKENLSVCVQMAARLKETTPGIYRDMYFGTGHTEYERCIRELWMQGVRIYTGEFWYQGETNYEEILANAAAFLRGKIDNALKE